MYDHDRLVSLEGFNKRFDPDLPAYLCVFRNVSDAIFVEIVIKRQKRSLSDLNRLISLKTSKTKIKFYLYLVQMLII